MNRCQNLTQPEPLRSFLSPAIPKPEPKYALGVIPGQISRLFNNSNPTICDPCCDASLREIITTTQADLNPTATSTLVEQPVTPDLHVDVLWRTTIAQQFTDKAEAVVIDGLGDIVVLGILSTTGTPAGITTIASNATCGGVKIRANSRFNGLIIKYSPTGDVKWYAHIENMRPAPSYGLCLDADDNIYVAASGTEALMFVSACGQVTVPSLQIQSPILGFVAKFSPEGVLQNLALMGDVALTDVATNAATDLVSAAVVVTGYFDAAIGFINIQTISGVQVYPVQSPATGSAVTVTKFDNALEWVWSTEIGNTAFVAYESRCQIETDASGNIYVAGDFFNNNFFGMAVLSAYNTNLLFPITVTMSNTIPNNAVFIARFNSGGSAQWLTRIKNILTTSYFPIRLASMRVWQSRVTVAVNAPGVDVAIYSAPNGSTDSGIVQPTFPNRIFEKSGLVVTYDLDGIFVSRCALMGNYEIDLRALAADVNGVVVGGRYRATAELPVIVYDANSAPAAVLADFDTKGLIWIAVQMRFQNAEIYHNATYFLASSECQVQGLALGLGLVAVGDFQGTLNIYNQEVQVAATAPNAGSLDAFVVNFYQWGQTLNLTPPVCNTLCKRITLRVSNGYRTLIKSENCDFVLCDASDNKSKILRGALMSDITATLTLLSVNCKYWTVTQSSDVELF